MLNLFPCIKEKDKSNPEKLIFAYNFERSEIEMGKDEYTEVQHIYASEKWKLIFENSDHHRVQSDVTEIISNKVKFPDKSIKQLIEKKEAYSLANKQFSLLGYGVIAHFEILWLLILLMLVLGLLSIPSMIYFR